VINDNPCNPMECYNGEWIIINHIPCNTAFTGIINLCIFTLCIARI
jgi:hypothetical protein